MKKFDTSALGMYNKFNLPEALLLINEVFQSTKISLCRLYFLFMNYI